MKLPVWFSICTLVGARGTAWLLVWLWVVPVGFGDTPRAAKKELLAELLAAAENGNPEAQYEVGRRLLRGEGVSADATAGAQWVLKAADQGLVAAQLEADRLCREGIGVIPDDAEAFGWLSKAAEQGDAEAQYQLGLRYRVGQGVERDFVAASQWARKAADQGHMKAEYFLGVCYANGQGVPQNDREAARWFRYAAEQGYADAQYNLGLQYDTGKGLRTDYIAAYQWLNLAAAQGNTTAMSARDKIVRKMTREQIDEAQRRSVAFVPRPGSIPALETVTQDDANSPVEANGTGFFITDDGYLLTACHVIVDARKIAIKRGKELVPAAVVRTDPVNDLALLKVGGPSQALALGNSRDVRIGDAVFTLGYPTLKTPPNEPRLAEGNVKSLAGPKDDPRHVQLSLPLLLGNTGGPVVDAQGNVIALVLMPPGTVIPASTESPHYFNAIKSSYAAVFLDSAPELVGKLKPPSTAKGRKFEELVKEAQEAVALVLAF
jgi:TPR repeat protein